MMALKWSACSELSVNVSDLIILFPLCLPLSDLWQGFNQHSLCYHGRGEGREDGLSFSISLP